MPAAETTGATGADATEPAPPTKDAPTSQRPKGFGLAAATALVMGNIIGGGIFALPATVAPYGTVSPLAFLVLSIGAVLLALFLSVSDVEGPAGCADQVLGIRAEHGGLAQRPPHLQMGRPRRRLSERRIARRRFGFRCPATREAAFPPA